MASRFVVTGWVGTGTKQDPYRPDIDRVNSTRLGVIKLRGHPLTNADALCLVVLDYPAAARVPTRDPVSTVNRLRDLGQDTGVAQLSIAVTAAVATDLGVVAPSRATIGELVVLKLGAALRPRRDGRVRVEINGHVLREYQEISGGAVDTFTYSNGVLATVSGGLWTAVFGSADVVSNAVTNNVAGTEDWTVWSSTFGQPQYSEVDVTLGTDYSEAGAVVRSSNAARTGYTHVWSRDPARYDIYEVTAGTYVSIAGTTTTATGTRRIKIEAEGSALRGFADGAATVNTTDTSLTGAYVGIIDFYDGTTPTLDNWDGGDLAGPAGLTVDQSALANIFIRNGIADVPVWRGSPAAADEAVATNAPAEEASATGTTDDATVQIAPTAGVASGTGTANQATVKVAPQAGVAFGTGAAADATATSGTNAAATAATATGTANQATVQITPAAGAASGTGAASSATVKIAPTATAASATGTANPPTVKIAPVIGAATGTGTAVDATVITGSITNAPATTANAIGTSNSATVKVAPRAGVASGTGAANNATVVTGTFAAAGAATGTGTANNPTVTIRTAAGTAAGTAIAEAATASIKPSAAVASATGTAPDASVVAVNGSAIIGGHGTGGVIWRDGGAGVVTGRDVVAAGVTWRDGASSGVTHRDAVLATIGAGTGTGAVNQP